MVEHKRRTGYATAVTLAASVLFCLVSTAGAVTTGRPEVRPAVATSPASAQAQGGSIALSGSPGTPAINLATNTIYVPIQCPQSYCPTKAPSYLVDIVNAATCNTRTQSRCRVVATAPAGTSPLAALVDDRTDTVYLPDVSGTVSVLDGSHCNAAVTSGCGKDIATIKVGGFLVAAAFDPRTRTLYVANPQGHVFVINTADCNSSSTSGCRRSVVAAVKDGNGPQALDVDLATDTVYTADDGTGNGDTVSVIDGATCNRTDTNGCDVAPHTVTVGSGAFWVAVDQTNDTVYAANFNDGSVSVINGARCNASVTLGLWFQPQGRAHRRRCRLRYV